MMTTKNMVKSVFRRLGYSISKITSENEDVPNMDLSMEGALQRCVSRGLKVNAVVDIGASDGRWSRLCMKFFPHSQYLLFEALENHREGLQNLKNERDNVDFVLAAAGNRQGKIYFDNGSLFGGAASETAFGHNCTEVPVVTVDSEIAKRNLLPPFLIKLDTHGFEVPILEGCRGILRKTELVIIETYNYRITNDSLKYYQMCEFMDVLGFSSIEIADVMLRRHDSSFWQMDTFFVPSSRVEFKYNRFE